MIEKTFYLTTTLPYVNGKPHIGFALEITAGDVIVRYQKSLGKEVVFNTGTDEHGQKIYQEALEAGQDPQDYVDEWAEKFASLREILNIDYTHFIRTTDPNHKKAAQEFWRRCDKNDDIYKRMYKISYCVGCELEKQASELDDGKCPLHPNKVIEEREEENYFFRFSKYQKPLLNLYETDKNFVKPKSKLKEIQSFVSGGLQDFSISRLKEKMPWGVGVPGDEEHVMYVWFDALVNYVSTLGWPSDMENFNKFWPAIQVCGKDNLRQQSAMWQAMLMSAGVPNSKQVLINGFINVDGQKMSKSLGNVISPTDLVERYGVEASRFLLMHLGPFGSDMDVTWEKLDTIYTAFLSNGLGNLCSRVAKLWEKSDHKFNTSEMKTNNDGQNQNGQNFDQNYQDLMNTHDLKQALEYSITLIENEDKFLSETKPWTLSGSEQSKLLEQVVERILKIATHLQPFMPQTSLEITNHFSKEKITGLQPLFPRLAS
jgi:methionyl-tRNA synthetase